MFLLLNSKKLCIKISVEKEIYKSLKNVSIYLVHRNLRFLLQFLSQIFHKYIVKSWRSIDYRVHKSPFISPKGMTNDRSTCSTAADAISRVSRMSILLLLEKQGSLKAPFSIHVQGGSMTTGVHPKRDATFPSRRRRCALTSACPSQWVTVKISLVDHRTIYSASENNRRYYPTKKKKINSSKNKLFFFKHCGYLRVRNLGSKEIFRKITVDSVIDFHGSLK